MSRTVVGRIFWKELRAQRSLWLGVTCLVIAIQTIVALGPFYDGSPSRSLEELCGSTFFLAYLGGTVFAIASGAASFTEEAEGNTALLLRTVPVTRLEAFVGKWGFGLASTGLLYLVLATAAACYSAIVWLVIKDIGGIFTVRHAGPGPRFDEVVSGIWIGLVIPILFFAFCALFSLLLSNGLIAAMCGTFSTIAVLAATLIGGGGSGSPIGFALRLSGIGGVLVLTDYWLTGVWLRQGTPLGLKWTGKWPLEWAGKREWRGPRLPGPIDLLRLRKPLASWKRASQRLLWKELKQAAPYFEISLLAASALLIPPLLDPHRQFLGNASPWIAGLAIPLLMGVGAYHVDRLGSGYRFLGERALPPDGSWIVKQAVWIGLTFVACAYALVVDETSSQLTHQAAYRFQDSILYGVGRSLTQPTFNSVPRDPLRLDALGIVALYIMLAYSIGQRMSFAISKGLVAFGAAMGATVFACQIWAVFSTRGVPLGWTIGAIPAALLAYTWWHTERWQTGRLYSYRWSLVAAWMLLPLVGIVVAACLYWPFPLG